MVLVVLFFVLLTAAALLSAYSPRISQDGAATAAASLLGLAIFFFLVRRFRPKHFASWTVGSGIGADSSMLPEWQIQT